MVGTFDPYREYRVIWSASSFTGGLPVNYSIKLCLNDSSENERICKKNFTDPECRLANVLRTDKDFRCVLQKPADFVSLCGKACNYTISVVAENAVGSATSWRYLPFVSSFSGNFVFLCVCNSCSTTCIFVCATELIYNIHLCFWTPMSMSPAKTRHTCRLTSVTWQYHGLKFRTHQVNSFF